MVENAGYFVEQAYNALVASHPKLSGSSLHFEDLNFDGTTNTGTGRAKARNDFGDDLGVVDLEFSITLNFSKAEYSEPMVVKSDLLAP